MNKALKNDMNTTLLAFPRITTLARVQASRPAASSPRTSLCRDTVNRELVLCAQGLGDHGSGRREQWLFVPLIAASLLTMMTMTATAGQWLDQWPAFVQWAERILR
jgi:hypothetical protein